MNKDFSKYKDSFLSEAKTHIEIMNNALLKLEKSPTDSQSFHEIFRSVHTLKSISAAIGYESLSKLCHLIEDLLDAIRHETVVVTNCVDLFFESFDFITKDLKVIESNNEEMDPEPLLQKLYTLLNGKSEENNNKFKEDKTTLSLSIEKVQSVGVKVERLDTLLNLIEDLLVNKMKLESIKDGMGNLELTSSVEALDRIINEFQYNVMQLRMVSIGLIFNQFPRMVRDIAKSQNKEVRLIIEGDDIELDRTIIDEISESLLHLVRNAIDHGLESTADRHKLNKPKEGTIKLSASRTKENIIIEISDDGAGLDLEEIRKKAQACGVISKNATENEIVNSIFSEISTAREVTHLSGRGLGLNIVKQKIESIGGTIQVRYKQNQGTTFSIKIPVSLAVIKTLFVKVLDRIYAIPVMNIDRLVVSNKDDFKHCMNYEAIILDNEEVPVISLRTLFGGEKVRFEKQAIVVVRKENERVGIAIDELLTTEEIVVKPLTQTIKENKYFSGSAIIGSGEMILIIDVANLYFHHTDQTENFIVDKNCEGYNHA